VKQQSQSSKLLTDLRRLTGGDGFADILHRAAYSTDASIYRIVPQFVIAPRNTDDVSAIVRYAGGHGIPIVARGAASGLAGESLCSGIVLDMTRYMNRIIEIKNNGQTAVCQPGVVLDQLNDDLAEYGRKIGPDPSSGNRATVGGVVANNATGPHSLQYGHIIDCVESLEAVLADGSIVEFENDLEPEKVKDEKVGQIVKQCRDVLSGKEDLIQKALPKSSRNRSGYSISGICHNGKIDLAKLMAGSEGTLAILTKITLKTVETAKVKALLQLKFDSLDKMALAVPAIVDTGAAACELMDEYLINMAADALPQYRDVLPTNCAASLLVEHIADSEKLVKEKIQNTLSAVNDKIIGSENFFEAERQKRLWKSRKNATPLLYREKAAKHPIAFIEDVSVDNTRLAAYIAGLEKIKGKYDIEVSYYGHAGDGELHLRPKLDLSKDAEIEKMKAIAREVFTLAWSLGGTISGEHADGLVRAAFVHQQYGDEFYELLRGIKRVFDPDNLMNPGKIINDDADIMVKNLRAEKKYVPERLMTELIFGRNEFRYELEQCSGCGVCLSRETDLRMCPVYRALGEELGSSRAKANILHFWTTGQLDDKDFESDEFKKFLSLCINCKACSLQCPAGVDISKLMAEARAQYVKRKGLNSAEQALSKNRYLSRLSSIFSPVSNFVMGLGISKWFTEKIIGLDKRRDMPHFERGSFIEKGRKYLEGCTPAKDPTERIAYFVDTFANYNDHQLGFAVLNVLRHNNIEVILPKQLPAPLPAIVYGDVKTAKRDLEFNVEHLAKVVHDGYKIVCSEPSAALCLKQELKHFVSGRDAELVSENTYELMGYLADLFKQGKLKAVEKSVSCDYAYHCPCHLLAVGGSGASIELLSKLCGVKIFDLNTGCCGLAGTYGMQKKNFALSEQISENLRKAIEKSGINTVLTECGACGMQIEHISGTKAIHPIKILAQAYSLNT